MDQITLQIKRSQAWLQSQEYFLRAKYIAQEYISYLENEIPGYLFLDRVGNMEIDLVLERLKYAMLGDNIFNGNDIMTMIKQDAVQQYGSSYSCTRNYEHKISRLRKLILDIIFAVTEASP